MNEPGPGPGPAPGTPGWLPAADEVPGAFRGFAPASPYGPVATVAPQPVPPPDGSPSARETLARRWLIAAIVLALVAGFGVGQLYYLKAHTVTRYAQAAPGEVVTVGDATYELVSLTTAPTQPGYDGPEPPGPGEAFVVATLRVTPHGEEPSSVLCALDLVADPHHTWSPTTYSTVPPEIDKDYCELLATGQESTIYLAWTIPASELGRVSGVVVDPYNGDPNVVLVPPA